MSTTALLIMDVQPGVVDRFAADGYLPRFATAASSARTAGISVIYVRVAFRDGYRPGRRRPRGPEPRRRASQS